MANAALQLLTTPQEFFHEKVTHASSSLEIKLDEQLEYYVVNLLCEFVTPDKLNQNLGKDVDVLDTPLAFFLKQALEASPNDQVKLYKRLGDTSLYFAGFFQEFFNRKSYDIDYYISMGRSAYQSLSSIMRDRHRDEHFTGMYGKLSDRFPDLVEIVAEVSDVPAGDRPVDILAVYDRWTKSQSTRLRRALERVGIRPVPTGGKDEN